MSLEIIDRNHTRISGVVYEHSDPSNWEISELQSILKSIDDDMKKFAIFLTKIGWKQVDTNTTPPGVA